MNARHQRTFCASRVGRLWARLMPRLCPEDAEWKAGTSAAGASLPGM